VLLTRIQICEALPTPALAYGSEEGATIKCLLGQVTPFVIMKEIMNYKFSQ
jgi:hypothetical protein